MHDEKKEKNASPNFSLLSSVGHLPTYLEGVLAMGIGLIHTIVISVE